MMYMVVHNQLSHEEWGVRKYINIATFFFVGRVKRKNSILYVMYFISFIGYGGQSFASSEVNLVVTGEVTEGTCTLGLSNGNLVLDKIDSSNTFLNEQTPVKGQNVTLSVTNCSPGGQSHKPALLFSGNVVGNKLWRDVGFDSSVDNDAGEAYGVLINEKTSFLICDNTNGKSILNGYCDLGGEGELLSDKNIVFEMGYGKMSNRSVNTGGIKSSITISFEYR